MLLIPTRRQGFGSFLPCPSHTHAASPGPRLPRCLSHGQLGKQTSPWHCYDFVNIIWGHLVYIQHACSILPVFYFPKNQSCFLFLYSDIFLTSLNYFNLSYVFYISTYFLKFLLKTVQIQESRYRKLSHSLALPHHSHHHVDSILILFPGSCGYIFFFGVSYLKNLFEFFFPAFWEIFSISSSNVQVCSSLLFMSCTVFFICAILFFDRGVFLGFLVLTSYRCIYFSIVSNPI